MEDGAPDFDLVAASLRADTRDLNAFVSVLADKLEDALPSQTTIQRKRAGFFSKEMKTEQIHVEIGEWRYDLRLRDGRVQTARGKVVRGIVLKTEELSLDEWIDALSRDLQEEARRSEAGRIALERLMGV